MCQPAMAKGVFNYNGGVMYGHWVLDGFDRSIFNYRVKC